MDTVILTYVFGGLLYGYLVFMMSVGNKSFQKWLYTIPIWPLTLIVLFLYIGWRGLKITFESVTR